MLRHTNDSIGTATTSTTGNSNKTISIALAYHVGMVRNWDTIVKDQMHTLQQCGLGAAADRFLLSFSNGNLDTLRQVVEPYGYFTSPFAPTKTNETHAAAAAATTHHEKNKSWVTKALGPPWEGPGLTLVRDYCQEQEAKQQPAVVFYFHNKGASKYNSNWKSHLNTSWTYSNSLYWRKYMEYFHLERPHLCLDKIINHGADTCGVMLHRRPYPHYSGNFWVASCRYLATLPSPLDKLGNEMKRLRKERTRKYLQAEFWVGRKMNLSDTVRHVGLHDIRKGLYRHLALPESYANPSL